MTIYTDENLPKHLAEGFQILQLPEGLKNGYPVDVKYIPTEFGSGAKDIDWIPELEDNACVITQDININRRKHELELYRKHGVRMFFLKGKTKKQGLSVWEMVRTLAKHWPEISKIASEPPQASAYEITLNRKIKRLP